MGPLTQTEIQTFLCAALAGATHWAVPQSTSTTPVLPFASSLSVFKDLCWTVAQPTVKKDC